jgi:hypothetical protein
MKVLLGVGSRKRVLPPPQGWLSSLRLGSESYGDVKSSSVGEGCRIEGATRRADECSQCNDARCLC